jgi:2-keto-3-deoxy-6-phosphogluconate aldolase
MQPRMVYISEKHYQHLQKIKEQKENTKGVNLNEVLMLLNKAATAMGVDTSYIPKRMIKRKKSEKAAELLNVFCSVILSAKAHADPVEED